MIFRWSNAAHPVYDNNDLSHTKRKLLRETCLFDCLVLVEDTHFQG